MTGTVADVVVERLRAWGVPRVFGRAGEGIAPLLAALRRAGGDPEFVPARHEEMAAYMASGHAKFTGRPGVCLATQGPGAIHLLGGLYDAKLDRRPVVAIVGQVVSTALGGCYLREVDLHALYKDVCGQYLQTVFAPEQALVLVDNAMRTAIATSAPACLILPQELQGADAPGELLPAPAAVCRPRAVPPQEDIRRAAYVLAHGKRVAMLVGRGAAEASRDVERVVERLGAGVAVSLVGKPVLSENEPWHTGVMGSMGSAASAELMAGCDTLLIVGCNDPWTEFYPDPERVATVQVDLDARVVGSRYPVDVALVGDAGETLRALLNHLPRTPNRTWQAKVAESVARTRTAPEGSGELGAELVVHELSNHLPKDARVAVDAGTVTHWYARHLRLPAGVPAHVPSYLASMGCALPYGLAAKLDTPDQPVVALAGECAMRTNGLLELITVADRWRDWTDPRFVVLVLCRRRAAAEFPFAAHAEMLGLRGLRIETPEAVAKTWQRAFDGDRPVVVEAIVARASAGGQEGLSTQDTAQS